MPRRSPPPADAALSDVRPHEQLLINASDNLYAGRILCNTVGRAQFARSFAERHPQSHVTCLFLDDYQRQQAAAGQRLPNLQLLCQSDPPDERFDAVALALGRSGEAELARDLLQAGHVRLHDGGSIIATTDNPNDTWLGQQMQLLADKVHRSVSPLGATYQATKSAPLKKFRSFECEFACRDEGRLLKLRTRPSVFSHRKVDSGARALLAALKVRPGLRMLEIGCGSGVVAVAAAARAAEVRVLAIDSNPRAVEATRWAAAANELPLLEAALDADGRTVEAGVYDVVVANPPYYSGYRISEIFIRTASKALSVGGELYVVTKRPEWYLERLKQGFAEIASQEIKHYFVVTAKRSSAD